MGKIGKALTYRDESYNCAPTVIHVVRMLQENSTKMDKYKTDIPEQYCGDLQPHKLSDPYCAMGKYGYILSIIEQIGYMYRFNSIYCDNNSKTYSEDICKKKIEKYNERLQNAILFFFNKLNTQSAGYKKQNRKRNKKTTNKKTTNKKTNKKRNKKTNKKINNKKNKKTKTKIKN